MATDRTILFESIRTVLPAVKNYPDDLLASKIKNVDAVAQEFVILVKAELAQKYFNLPDSSQNLLLARGADAMRYVKRTIESWNGWKVTVKSLCENIDLLQNKFADESPLAAEYNIKYDYRTIQLA